MPRTPTPPRLFISGIGTGVGKTLAAAVLTEALHADYWKPVQSGDLHHTDTDQVKTYISNPHTQFHPENLPTSHTSLTPPCGPTRWHQHQSHRLSTPRHPLYTTNHTATHRPTLRRASSTTTTLLNAQTIRTCAQHHLQLPTLYQSLTQLQH